MFPSFLYFDYFFFPNYYWRDLSPYLTIFLSSAPESLFFLLIFFLAWNCDLPRRGKTEGRGVVRNYQPSHIRYRWLLRVGALINQAQLRLIGFDHYELIGRMMLNWVLLKFYGLKMDMIIAYYYPFRLVAVSPFSPSLSPRRTLQHPVRRMESHPSYCSL